MNALPLTGLISGLAISTDAQRFSCVGTGALTQPAGTAGCISEDGSGPCSDGRGLSFPTDVAVSPEGNSVYTASGGSNAVARFNRAP